jgi:hypothetical protein
VRSADRQLSLNRGQGNGIGAFEVDQAHGDRISGAYGGIAPYRFNGSRRRAHKGNGATLKREVHSRRIARQQHGAVCQNLDPATAGKRNLGTTGLAHRDRFSAEDSGSGKERGISRGRGLAGDDGASHLSLGPSRRGHKGDQESGG